MEAFWLRILRRSLDLGHWDWTTQVREPRRWKQVWWCHQLRSRWWSNPVVVVVVVFCWCWCLLFYCWVLYLPTSDLLHSESFDFNTPAEVAWSKLYRAWVSWIEWMYGKRTWRDAFFWQDVKCRLYLDRIGKMTFGICCFACSICSDHWPVWKSTMQACHCHNISVSVLSSSWHGFDLADVMILCTYINEKSAGSSNLIMFL